jgi:hypothetical protein
MISLAVGLLGAKLHGALDRFLCGHSATSVGAGSGRHAQKTAAEPAAAL